MMFCVLCNVGWSNVALNGWATPGNWFRSSRAYRTNRLDLSLMFQSTRPVASQVFWGGPAPKSAGPTRVTSQKGLMVTILAPPVQSAPCGQKLCKPDGLVPLEGRGTPPWLGSNMACEPGAEIATRSGVGTVKVFGPALRTRMGSAETAKNSLL